MARIIASAFAESREQVAELANRAAMAGADWVELRLDRWPAGADLGPAIAGVRLPVLVACRTPEDGGQFRGTLGERRELLSHALAAGAQGLDLEIWETWAPPAGRTRLKLLVRSFHSFTGVPKELPEIRDRLHALPGTVAKIAVTAHDLADAAPVFDLLQATDQRQQPTIAFAMGRTAWPVRVLACAMGAPYVYASIDEGAETAPGQVPVSLLAGLYHVHALSGASAVYGLLGNPALRSLGPWLHNRVFRRLGLDAVYLPFETSRPEAVVRMLPRRQLRGLSVTAPWKGSMAAVCQRLSEDATATGVVNTIVAEAHGVLAGHNTDVAGVRAALDGVVGNAPDAALRQRAAVVLGTGGAARAGVLALLQMGFAVTMLGRSLEPAREFARSHGVRLGSLGLRQIVAADPVVVVHATPVGGVDRDVEERLVEDYRPGPGTVVLDMVYQPFHTRLLRDALQAGATVVPGVEMFLGQAAAQVRLFTGADVDSATLRACLAGTAVARH
ncbi:MAG TPA: type I 3-dehydroquinate dehydratase [Planctomycetota bacterium]|nr:type I 3-dehydroquinate dehydratase [Planctomycetota bacterium]